MCPRTRTGSCPIRKYALTLTLAGVLMLGITTDASAKLRPDVVAYWDRIARCETGGNWQMRGSTYSGGVGFYNRTYEWWARELGLLSRYPSANMAPRLVQIRVADYGWRRYRGYWGCRATVGYPPG